MAETTIRFEDGEGYELMMGKWSQLAGDVFLQWLAPPAGQRWLDVGCGNGAFTELIVDKCAPASVAGIDPSEGQLAYARVRPASKFATFVQGDAMALPWGEDTFDTAAMALVLFFVPEPSRGVAEMARVVAPGGTVAAYAWDFGGNGFPLDAMYQELRAAGRTPLLPPSVDASRIDVMQSLWTGAGLVEVETRSITVRRTFADFEECWSTSLRGSSMGPIVAAMPPDELAGIKQGLRARLTAAADGSITFPATANAVKGKVAQDLP